jgi:hypothetical protein
VSEIRCRHDLLTEQCFDCRTHAKNATDLERELAEERARKLANPSWFPARMVGTCHTCGERFERGDPIHRAPHDEGWACC